MNVQTNNNVSFKGNIATLKNENVPQKLLQELRKDLVNLKRQTPKDVVTILHPAGSDLNLIQTKKSLGAGIVGNIDLSSVKESINKYTRQFRGSNGKFTK